jgi:hypothetical protein
VAEGGVGVCADERAEMDASADGRVERAVGGRPARFCAFFFGDVCADGLETVVSRTKLQKKMISKRF